MSPHGISFLWHQPDGGEVCCRLPETTLDRVSQLAAEFGRPPDAVFVEVPDGTGQTAARAYTPMSLQ